MFTYQYQQPDEYHFSLDSIELAAFVAKEMHNQSHLETIRMLDLCAGCGVIGLQTSWHLREIRLIDFVEVQEIYEHYFHQNVSIVNRPELDIKWHLINYNDLLDIEWQNKYDLIISNPPYFLAGHGMLSPSNFKNRCRFYLDSSYQNFILAMANTLAVGGKGYFLLRPLLQHGFDMMAESQKILANSSIAIYKIATIRGTDVVCMKK